MGRNPTNRVVRRIECGLLIVEVTCLLWVGATSLSAFLYQIEHSVGHLPNTSLPWQEGNTAVAGHRDVQAERMANVSESSYETINREGNTP